METSPPHLNRREALRLLGASAAAAATPAFGAETAAEKAAPFAIRYTLSSAMYGDMPLDEVMGEVKKAGAESLDIWGKVHATHREEIDAIGWDAFGALLEKHGVAWGVNTRYPLGPFGLEKEMPMMKRFGCQVAVCGTAGGPKEPAGEEAKKGIAEFLEKMKPHAEKAEAHGITIALENHDRQLLYTPDSLRYFAELNKSKALGVAFAPHHLHAWVDEIPALLRDLGAANLPFIYFQEHGEGIRKKVPKEIEMKQMPGFGSLDYRPILAALRDIGFTGWAEIFMHPTPRGEPILPTKEEITAAINKSRAYLADCLG